MASILRSALLVATVAILSNEAVKYLLAPQFPVHGEGGVLVSGASSGIGEHAAAALVKEGYTVFAGVRRQADAQRLKNSYPAIRPVVLDVTSADSINKVVAEVTGSGIPLVALVNNAGVQKDLPVELQDSAADRFTFDVNVLGLLDVTRAFIPILRRVGGGARIVNVGSLAGVVSAPGSASYAGSKFAVEGISDALRMELQPLGISVSLLQPGYVRSKMGEKAHETSSTSYGVDQGQYDLYKHVFEGFFAEDRRLSSPEMTEPPKTTTTPAVLHAIQSPNPLPRYPVTR